MKLYTAVILVIFWLGVFTVHTAKGSVGSQPMRKFACVTLSTQKLDIRQLVNYEKQQVPLNAVMFITAKGIKICVHPDQKWVQVAMKRIDQKRTAKKK
ncbi:lymphotactin-like [Anser cygnoides]|uniref:Chemokine interleukin-8-like domain-containing protein n=1 Tax=Anser cygnoides TaxID=8845 RepID=A0A8B9DJ53_ANSCY|nr:lymphotactin-like [Anser cygnoides]